MQNIFSKIIFFLLSLFVFLIPLQTVYIFRQGPIGQDGAAREGIWQFGTLALYATDVFFLLIFIVTCIRFFLCHSRESSRFLSETLSSKKSQCPWYGNPAYPKWPVSYWLSFFTETAKRCLESIFCQSQNSKKNGAYISLVLLLCIAFLSVAWSPDKILAVQTAVRLFEGIVIFFLFSRMSSARWNMVAWLFVVGACIQSVLGAIQFFMQEIPAISWLGISHHASWVLGDAVVESREVRWLRAYGSFPHPNILAAYLVVGYFFCIAIVMRSEKKIQTWFVTLAGACILFGLVLTFSREAWLGLIAGLVVMGIVSCYAVIPSGVEGSRRFLLKSSGFFSAGWRIGMTNTFISPLFFFFLVSFITVVFSCLLFSEPLSMRLGIGGWNRLEVKSVQERIGSIKEFISLSPTLVRGVGIGQYTNTLYQNDVKNNAVRPSYTYQPVHNVFLLVLAELGIAGFIAFMGFLFLLIWRVCHPERNKVEREDLVGFSSERWDSSLTTRNDRLIGIGLLSFFIIISFFDHFFWTIHSGAILWWVSLAGLDRYFDT